MRRPAPVNSPPQYADVVAKALAKLAVDVRAEFYRRHPDLDTIAATRSVHGFRLYVTHLVELLLEDLGVQRAERQRHQRRAKIFTELETGLWGLSGRWDPLTGQTLNTAITAEVNAIYHARRGDNTDLRTREQITADAITNLICNTPVSNRTRVAGVTAIVLCDRPDRRQRTPRRGRCTNMPMAPRSPSTPSNRCSTTRPRTSSKPTSTSTASSNQLGDAVLNHGRNKRFATADQKLASAGDASQLPVSRLRHALRPLRTTPPRRIPAPRQHRPHRSRPRLLPPSPPVARPQLETPPPPRHPPVDDHLPRRHHPHPPPHRTRPTQQRPTRQRPTRRRPTDGPTKPDRRQTATPHHPSTTKPNRLRLTTPHEPEPYGARQRFRFSQAPTRR